MEDTTKKEPKKKYSIPNLVMIGDHLHNCDAAIVICNNKDEKQGDGANSLMVSVMGNRDDLVKIMYLAMKENKHLEDIFSGAVTTFMLGKLKEAFDKNNEK